MTTRLQELLHLLTDHQLTDCCQYPPPNVIEYAAYVIIEPAPLVSECNILSLHHQANCNSV